MFRSQKLWVFVAVILAALALALPVLAQEPTPSTGAFPQNTITVTGTGTALGDPDTATLQVGVDTVSTDISEAFAEANATIDAIVAAVQAAGVAPEDIQTTNLNLYNEMPYDPMMAESNPEPQYRLSNTVSVIIRDIDNVQPVIEAAINAGATNLYGLTFLINDPAEQERSAREEALNNAQDRAQQLAELIGAELGEVVVVNESTGGYFPPIPYGGGIAEAADASFISPGQSTVQVQVQVTYAIAR